MTCTCAQPREPADPRRKGSCLCGKPIDQAAPWVLNDATHNAWLDRVEETLCVMENWADREPPPEWVHFRNMALERERAGRERFGFAYLTRDNIQSGAEENSDGLNYTFMDTLQVIHSGDREEWDLILTAAYHDFMAYRTRLKLKAKRLGSPA